MVNMPVFLEENSTRMRFNYKNPHFPVHVSLIDSSWNVNHVLHWHENIEFMYQVKGYNRIRCGNQTVCLEEGQVFVFNPFELHCHSLESSSGCYHMISFDAEALLMSSQPDSPRYDFNNYGQDITVHNVAEQIQENVYQLIRLFKASTGKTPIEYIHQYRVLKASELLKDGDRRIIDVAMDVGFSNLSYFNKIFRKYANCTPTVMRNSYLMLDNRTLPAHWNSIDIGDSDAQGSSGSNHNAFFVNSCGDTIWGDRDAFHFAYTKVKGDFSVSCLIDSMVPTDLWAKAGLMIRESLKPSSKFAHIFATPYRILGFEWRPRTGADCETLRTKKHYNRVEVPVYVRLERVGRRFTSFYSTNGREWRTFPYAYTEFSMKEEVFIGFAVSSHDKSKMCSAKFEEIVINSLGVH